MRRIRALSKEDISTGLQGLSMACCSRGLGMSTGQIELFLVDVMKDIISWDMRCYIPMWVTFPYLPSEIANNA